MFLIPKDDYSIIIGSPVPKETINPHQKVKLKSAFDGGK
jgi:hypothetical protein